MDPVAMAFFGIFLVLGSRQDSRCCHNPVATKNGIKQEWNQAKAQILEELRLLICPSKYFVTQNYLLLKF